MVTALYQIQHCYRNRKGNTTFLVVSECPLEADEDILDVLIRLVTQDMEKEKIS